MFKHLHSCADEMIDSFDASKRIVIDAKDLFARFTAEVISVSALGFSGNCIKDKDSEVFKVAQDILDDSVSPINFFKFVLMPIFPKFFSYFGITFFRKSIYDFFDKYASGEIKRREREGITNANDLLQILQDAKNNKKGIQWTEQELVAQVFIFFVGG